MWPKVLVFFLVALDKESGVHQSAKNLSIEKLNPELEDARKRLGRLQGTNLGIELNGPAFHPDPVVPSWTP